MQMNIILLCALRDGDEDGAEFGWTKLNLLDLVFEILVFLFLRLLVHSPETAISLCLKVARCMYSHPSCWPPLNSTKARDQQGS